MIQHNLTTNKNNRILDLVLTNGLLSCSVKACDEISRIDRHHPPLNIIIKSERLKTIKENIIPKFIFSKTNYDECLKALIEFDWNSYCDLDCNDFVQLFYNKLWELIELHTPKAKIRKSSYPKWFSNSLVKMMKEKDKYHSKYKRFGNPRDLDTFSMLRKRTKILIDMCFRSHISHIENNLSGDIKIFWNYIKSRKTTTDYPKLMSYEADKANNGQDIANLFARFFSSVYNDFSLRFCHYHIFCHVM